MNARSALPPLAVGLLLLLSACGNKGPLVLPEPAPVETTPTAPGAVPVKVDPQAAMPEPETEGALRDPTSADPLSADPVTGPPPPAAEPDEDDQDDDATAPPADDGTGEDDSGPPSPPDGHG